MGLCPPDGAAMDGGGTYKPSRFQRKMWLWWEEFWHDWVPRVCRGDPFGVVCLGEPIDGTHHGSVTQFTQNLVVQGNLAIKILQPIVELCEGRFWMLRGTEAHDGKSGQQAERVAREVKAIPNREGQHARYRLRKLVGHPGTKPSKCALVDCIHQIGTTGRQHYETSAPHAELIEAFTEAGRWGRRPPDAIVRGHRHRFIKTEVPTKSGRAMAIVAPGWQGKTPFAYRVAGGRQSTPQFGGVLLRSGDEELIYERHWVQDLEQDPIE